MLCRSLFSIFGTTRQRRPLPPASSATGARPVIPVRRALLCLCAVLCCTLLSACSLRESQPSPANGDASPSPAASSFPAPTGILAPPSDYLVIPLTSGDVSPISACSYDLLHTYISISLYDSTDYGLLDECFALIDSYERLLSRNLEGSETYLLNHGSGTRFAVSQDLLDLTKISLSYGALTNGALDISIAPVSALWDFTSAGHASAAPDAAAIAAAIPLVNYADVSVEGNEIVFAKEGMQLEFGAVAKGYIADRVKEYLVQSGVRSAIINLGGNVLLIGEKPNGDAFSVGIQKPFEDRNAVVVAVSKLRDVSMVSSGIYERYFYDEDGRFYHHILDAKTGYPCENDLLQVTIVSRTSVDGDALSTACFALGMEKGMELIHSLEDVYAVFLTADGTLHFSDGYLEAFPTETE